MEEGISDPLKEVLQVPLSTLMQLKLLCTPAVLQFLASCIFQHLLLQTKLQHLKSMDINFKRIILYFGVNL